MMIATDKKEIATEGGHWYTTDGVPAYTQISKKGLERPTTLRDARKLNLVPSVTTILGVAAKPALTVWMVDQALMAALTLPRIEGESLDDFKKRALADSKAHSREAADEGTRIHTAIEMHFLGKRYDRAYRPHVEAVVALLDTHFPGEAWRAEKSFCSPLGYGGKVDLHSDRVVVDFKGKDFGPDDTVSAYLEQAMQLAAYRAGLGVPGARLVNIFVSRNHPGVVQMVEHDEDDDYFLMFCDLLSFWKRRAKYWPEVDKKM